MMYRSVLHSSLTVVSLSMLGCATERSGEWDMSHARVSVRFVSPIGDEAFARAPSEGGGVHLTSDTADGAQVDESVAPCAHGFDDADFGAHHAVLWGGPYSGDDVTTESVPLVAGSYSFGLFDHDEGAAYQGWIDVHRGGDSLVSLLTEWRDTVREQREWAGFDRKIGGDFFSTDDEAFEDFMKELREIEKLERKIDAVVRREVDKAKRERANVQALAVNADVLMMPGHAGYFRSSTQPSFSQAELASVRSGDTVTKLVFVADQSKTAEKLRRVNQLWNALERRQRVIEGEQNRLRKRHRFYTMTDHLYDHGDKFTKTAERLEQVEAMADRLDRRMARLNEHRQAMLLMTALFSNDAEFNAFEEEEANLRRERAVVQEEKTQVDLKFDAASENSCRRVALERARQRIVARLDDLDRKLKRIEGAQEAFAQMRSTTGVIHRQGTARVLATVVSAQLPTHLAEAAQRESVMTVRLQSASTMFVPERKDAVPVDYRP